MKVLLLNSGGKDSLGAAMALKYHELHSVYLDAGWPCREAALVAAESLAGRYCATHSVLSIALPMVEVLPGHQTVAYQAQVLHLIGAALACGRGYAAVASGQWTDAAMPSFPDDLDRMLASNKLFRPVQFLMPLWALTIEEIETLVKQDPLWRETVYCNCAVPCGECVKCRKRKAWLDR